MALEGKIKDFGITDILQLIGMQKKTGVLTLTSEENTVTVSFSEGMIVSAEAYKKGKRYLLGEMLVQCELLKKEDLEKALSIQSETGKKLGYILIQEKMLRPEELTFILHLQHMEIIYRTFEWEAGGYRFEQIPVNYDKETTRVTSCDKVLMQAMQMTDEWPRIRKTIPSYAVVYKSTDDSLKIRSAGGDLDRDIDRIFDAAAKDKDPGKESRALQKELPLSPSEEKIYQLVDGKRSVQKLIYLGRMGEFDTCKALYGLITAVMVQPVGEEAHVLDEESGYGKSRLRKVLRNLAAYVIILFLVSSLFWASRAVDGGVLSNLAGHMSDRFEPLRVLSADQEMHRILLSTRIYFLEMESMPEGIEDLVQKGLLETKELRDPWGRDYRIRIEERKVVLFSSGTDEKENTKDDLVREIFF